MIKNKKHNLLSNILFAFFWQFKVTPLYTLFSFVQMFFGDIVTVLEHTFLVAYIIHCVENKLSFGNILEFFIPVSLLVIAKVIMNPFVNSYIEPKVDAKIEKEIYLRLYTKAISIEILKYDDSKFYNDFIWAMQKAPRHIMAATNTLRKFLSKIVVIFLAGSYIAFEDTMSFCVVLVIIIITFILQYIMNKVQFKKEEEILPVSRKRDYVNRVFYLSDYVKDIKSSTISKKFEKDFSDTSEKMIDLVNKYGVKIGGLEVLRDSTEYVVYNGCYLSYLFYQSMIKAQFGLATLLALYRATSQVCENLQNMFNLVPEFQQHSIYIEKLRVFLDSENNMIDKGSLRVPKEGDLILKNVSFTYPGSSCPAVKNVSMHIKKGEKIALVGYNGAGKTTLIKLLMRLYDPDSGIIQFGGYRIDDYPVSEYRKKFGVLFQDFEVIATDIGHNINMSESELDKKRADTILKNVNFWGKFETLPNGYETILTKEFDNNGLNLSGGEMQKIALARVLYANTEIIILDEPSSALDPLAEYQLNRAITELAKEKTVITISHRLSTTRFVDKIYMFEGGEIVEQGNHDFLVKMNGKYAEMFNVQAEKYR